MSCGCKNTKNKLPNLISENVGELNIKDKFLKIPIALLLTLIIVLISPFIIILIWWIAIKSTFGGNPNVVDLMLFNFKDKMRINENEFDNGEYELVDMDVIE